MRSGRNIEKTKVRVWDLATRFFHWSLVALVAVAWVSSEADGALFNVHIASGIAILALIVFRVLWGVFGSTHSRFASFVRPWVEVRDYGLKMLSRDRPHYLGHNPIGGWMVLVLLAALLLTVVSGLFTSDDGNAGPLAVHISRGLSHAMEDIHEGMANFLAALIGVHVLGVIVHGLIAGENLPRAMWTGDKFVAPGILESASSGIRQAPIWRVFMAASLSMVVVWSALL